MTLVRKQVHRGMTVGRKQDHSLVCLNVGQLLGLKVRGVIGKPTVLQSTAGVAANITLGEVLGTVLLSGLSTEGTGGVAHSSKEDITSFVVAGTKASGVPEAACAKTGTGTPSVGANTTACATTTPAGIAVTTSRAAPAAATTPSTGGGSFAGSGRSSLLARAGSFLDGVSRRGF